MFLDLFSSLDLWVLITVTAIADNCTSKGTNMQYRVNWLASCEYTFIHNNHFDFKKEITGSSI